MTLKGRDSQAQHLKVSRRKAGHQSPTYLAASHEGSITGVGDAQDGVPMGDVLDASRGVEGHLLGTQVRVLLLSILQLHVSAELVPGDGALRRPVNLHEQRVDLLLLCTARFLCFFCALLRTQDSEC